MMELVERRERVCCCWSHSCSVPRWASSRKDEYWFDRAMHCCWSTVETPRYWQSWNPVAVEDAERLGSMRKNCSSWLKMEQWKYKTNSLRSFSHALVRIVVVVVVVVEDRVVFAKRFWLAINFFNITIEFDLGHDREKFVRCSVKFCR